jgi:hypothetical protein
VRALPVSAQQQVMQQLPAYEPLTRGRADYAGRIQVSKILVQMSAMTEKIGAVNSVLIIAVINEKRMSPASIIATP